MLVGDAFHAEFREFQVESATLLTPSPREALDVALESVREVGSVSLDPGESIEKEVEAGSFPVTIRAALLQLVEREKGKLILGSRAVKYRLAIAEGSAMRLSGYCAGQEFSFWMAPGKTAVITEKDPVSSLGNQVALAAEEALVSEDWKKALTLARETLAFSPDHPGASEILSTWRTKVFRETVAGAALVSLVAVVAHTVRIMSFESGLNKAGAAFQIGLFLAGLGMILGLLLFPLLLRLYSTVLRRTTMAICLLVCMSLGVATVRWGLDWNPVRTADQAALDAEIKNHFKYGFPEVYYEPDLQYLHATREKYKGSQADLTKLAGALEYQLALKAKQEKAQETFDRRIQGILSSNNNPAEKRALVLAARDKAHLANLDVGRVEEVLRQIQLEERKLGMKKNKKKTRITITKPKRKKKSTLR